MKQRKWCDSGCILKESTDKLEVKNDSKEFSPKHLEAGIVIYCDQEDYRTKGLWLGRILSFVVVGCLKSENLFRHQRSRQMTGFGI